ncbi:DNA-processing protein DprA [Kutzneria chonburiensis]|uniref:DNA-processing protein DprA n=1 Tax=Kutzneria chonburiensis TaxID=1483604 RepID=A0ABV6N153_9PSEU|nr:DNA-processing protein DprA [Kutzneria chonburiensis]
MVDNLEQAALLLALRHSDRGWGPVTSAVEDAGSALDILDVLLAPSTPTLDHVDRDVDTDLKLVAAEIDSWRAEGIRLVTVLDEEFPVQLLLVHQRPPFLTYRGVLDGEDVTAVSVVGSRQASAAGLRRARAVASTLANNGFTVMSGLAAGIDTAAHRAAIDAGTRTVAVVGTGLRHCYPAENRDLHGEIARTGAVLSQFWPDAGPAKHQFPMRNAVMSGCSIATVVVEAGEHSGARIQARIAVEHGRHVFLLPEVLANQWAVDLARRPNTTVLDGPEHLLRVLGELTAELVQL